MKLKINLSESEIVKEKNEEKEFGIILSVLISDGEIFLKIDSLLVVLC